MATSGSILGNPVRRREDPGILSGATEYFDDLKIAGLLHVAFVRSTIAHAVLEAIDTSDAVSMPGVVAVYTADDLDLPDSHGFMMLPPTKKFPTHSRVLKVGQAEYPAALQTTKQLRGFLEYWALLTATLVLLLFPGGPDSLRRALRWVRIL